MKTFRGNEVIGWKIIESIDIKIFGDRINELMEQYNFEDFQFSTSIDIDKCVHYSATILISEKDDSKMFDDELRDSYQDIPYPIRPIQPNLEED